MDLLFHSNLHLLTMNQFRYHQLRLNLILFLRLNPLLYPPTILRLHRCHRMTKEIDVYHNDMNVVEFFVVIFDDYHCYPYRYKLTMVNLHYSDSDFVVNERNCSNYYCCCCSYSMKSHRTFVDVAENGWVLMVDMYYANVRFRSTLAEICSRIRAFSNDENESVYHLVDFHWAELVMNEVPVAVVAEKLEMFEMMADDIDDESNSQMFDLDDIDENVFELVEQNRSYHYY